MRNIIIFFLINYYCFAGEYADNAKALERHFSDNFQSAIVAPGTSNSDFKTVDGRSTFKANMTCEGATKSVAEISYTGTSEIATSIKIDMNGDGIKELQNNISGISGICAEGVIKCDSNSWNNCLYYRYKYNFAGIYTQLTTKSNVSNCYCINSSCGSPAIHNKKSILDDITAGIYGVLQTNLPRFVLTKTSNDGTTSEIFGENQDSCINYKTGVSNYSYNEKDGASIVNQGQEILASDQNNQDTAAGTLLKATANENSIDFTTEKNSLKTKASSIIPATQNNKVVSIGTETFDFTKTEDITNVKYCQVQKLKSNSQVYTDETTAYTSNTTNKEIYEYFLRECTGVDYTNCPYETGETIKYRCGEVNQKSFNETLSGLNALKSMANDMTCSGN